MNSDNQFLTLLGNLRQYSKPGWLAEVNSRHLLTFLGIRQHTKEQSSIYTTVFAAGLQPSLKELYCSELNKRWQKLLTEGHKYNTQVLVRVLTSKSPFVMDSSSTRNCKSSTFLGKGRDRVISDTQISIPPTGSHCTWASPAQQKAEKKNAIFYIKTALQKLNIKIQGARQLSKPTHSKHLPSCKVHAPRPAVPAILFLSKHNCCSLTPRS